MWEALFHSQLVTNSKTVPYLISSITNTRPGTTNAEEFGSLMIAPCWMLSAVWNWVSGLQWSCFYVAELRSPHLLLVLSSAAVPTHFPAASVPLKWKPCEPEAYWPQGPVRLTFLWPSAMATCHSAPLALHLALWLPPLFLLMSLTGSCNSANDCSYLRL